MKLTNQVSVEEFIAKTKHRDFVPLYEQVVLQLHDLIEGKFTSYGILNRYIACRKNQNFVSFWFSKRYLRIDTKQPRFGAKLGRKFPDSYKYSLNYTMKVTNKTDLNEVIRIIVNSYHCVQ